MSGDRFVVFSTLRTDSFSLPLLASVLTVHLGPKQSTYEFGSLVIGRTHTQIECEMVDGEGVGVGDEGKGKGGGALKVT